MTPEPLTMAGAIDAGIAESGALGNPPAAPAPAPAVGPAPGAAPAAPEAVESFTTLRPEDLPAELQGRYKQMQADYTRKTQELAERRKPWEALQEEYLQVAQTVAALADNPAAQADYLESQAQRLRGASFAPDPALGQPAPYGQAPADPYAADPYYNSDPADPYNRMAAEVQQLKQAQQLQQMTMQVEKLESRLGRSLTPVEIAKVAPVLRAQPTLTVEQAYRQAHFDELMASERQKGAEDAIRLYQQSLASPAPPGALPQRQGEAPAPTSIRGFAEAAVNELGIR